VNNIFDAKVERRTSWVNHSASPIVDINQYKIEKTLPTKEAVKWSDILQ